MHPWLGSEKEVTAKMAKYKNEKYKKGDGRLEDSDSSDLDIESVPAINKSTDPRTIKCLHSRLLLFMARQIRHLNEHLSVIEKLDVALKHSEGLAQTQNPFAALPKTPSPLPPASDANEKNPLWRALGPLALVDREKFIAYCRNYIDRCAVQSQPSATALSADNSKKSRSPNPSHPLTLSPQPAPFSALADNPDFDSSDPKDHLAAIESGNKHIDGQLEDVSLGVSHLKTIAVDIGREVDDQNTLIPAVHGRVDVVDIQLEAAHHRVQRALEMLRQGHILVYIFLCLTWTGLLIWLFSVVFD